MVWEDFLLHLLPVHPYFYLSTTGFPHPNDRWTGLCIKLWCVCMRVSPSCSYKQWFLGYIQTSIVSPANVPWSMHGTDKPLKYLRGVATRGIPSLHRCGMIWGGGYSCRRGSDVSEPLVRRCVLINAGDHLLSNTVVREWKQSENLTPGFCVPIPDTQMVVIISRKFTESVWVLPIVPSFKKQLLKCLVCLTSVCYICCLQFAPSSHTILTVHNFVMYS